VLDVVFNDDQSRLRKGHGAHNMAVVRHFAINLVRKAEEPARPRSGLRRATKKPAAPKATSIKPMLGAHGKGPAPKRRAFPNRCVPVVT
ncbi:MAG TPA: hypothetical protein VGE72_14485, partial [Azospirillum sp.]